MKKQMERRALRAAMFIAAGVITTLAIAWAAAWWRPLSSSATMVVQSPKKEVWFLGWEDYGLAWSMPGMGGAVITATPEMIEQFDARSPPNWMPRPPAEDGDTYGAVSIGAGWPMACFVATCEGIAHHEPPPGGPWRTGLGAQWVQWIEWRGALGNPEPVDPPGLQRIIPVGIRPTGMLANLAFWSAAWWLPFGLFGLVRRRRRLKRGWCLSCGYELRGDLAGGCSECGWNRPRGTE